MKLLDGPHRRLGIVGRKQKPQLRRDGVACASCRMIVGHRKVDHSPPLGILFGTRSHPLAD